MIRGAAKKAGIGREGDFLWRGHEVTRIEGFTDAVFAFAITLLVVSLEVPRSYAELMHAMRGFFAFAICFAILMGIWYDHYLYFRRYGLQDMYALTLNGVLLFVVLFYVYPLKFLFTLVIDEILGLRSGMSHAAAGGAGGAAGDAAVGMAGAVAGVAAGATDAAGTAGGAVSPHLAAVPPLTSDEVVGLFLIYNVGFIAVGLVFALLYHHAERRSAALELTPAERLHTREKLWNHVSNVIIGAISALVILLGGAHGAMWAGFTYFLIGPARAVIGSRYGRARRLLAASGRS